MKQNPYFTELSRRLGEQGIEAFSTEGRRLKVRLHGEPVLFVSPDSEVFFLDSVYRRLSQNNAPDSDAANLHSGEERGSIFRISSGNSPPAFQDQESIFHQMAQPVQIFRLMILTGR